AGAMAVVSGLALLAAGWARLGFVTELLSKPIRYGYMNGIALTVILSQIPKLLGFSAPGDGPLRKAWAIGESVLAGRPNIAALAIGGGTLLLILFLKRWPRIPGLLIGVVAATIVAGVMDLAATSGLSVLGPLPRGLPLPKVPLITLADLSQVVVGG